MPKRKTKKNKKGIKKGVKKRIKKRINRKTKKKKMKGGSDHASDTAAGATSRLDNFLTQYVYPDPEPEDSSTQCYSYYKNTHTHSFPHRVFIDYNEILTQMKEHIAEETDSYSSQVLQSDKHLMSNLFTLIRDYTRSNSAFRDEYEELFDRIPDGQYNSELVDLPPEHAWVINTFIHIINGMDLFDELFAEQDTSAKIEYETYVEEYIPKHILGGSGTHPPDSIDCPKLFEECDEGLFEEFPLPKPHYEEVESIKRIIEPAGHYGDIKNRIKYFIISHYITDAALRRYLKAMREIIVRP